MFNVKMVEEKSPKPKDAVQCTLVASSFLKDYPSVGFKSFAPA